MLNHRVVKVKFSKNVLIENAELINSLGDKCLIVTGKNSAKASGALQDFLSVYKKEYVIFDEISENPKAEVILKTNSLLSDIDFVVGIGGGSALDAAKVVANIKNNPATNEEELYKQKFENPALPLILIGTSAGTGSEITKVAVISKANRRKSSLKPDSFYATYALCNPIYTYSMSEEIRLTTGIDAYAHCLESYFSNKANTESREYAIKGLKIIIPCLEVLKNNSLNDEVKDNLYLGSLYGGLAIDITGTTFAHNVGYYLSEEHKIHHGFACGEFLNDLLVFEENNNKEYFNQFINELDYDAEYLKKLLNTLMPKIDIHLKKEEIENLLPRFENNGSVLNTYGHITTADIKEILFKHFGF